MRKLILLFIIVIMLPVATFAQSKTVTGTVKDVSGIIPGATVTEVGTNPANIAITNNQGKFSITLKGSSQQLSVRFIGYAVEKVNVAGKTSVDIILQANEHGLDEVSVVGFTPHKRITTTGAISTINASEINTIPTSSVQNTLAGRLPGFTAVQTSGQPGKDASDFFIRGQSSLNTTNQPLILVDDIEYTYDQLQQINVNEIESISILKDALETAIYGIKGANGVLVVTTKRGKSGAPKFNFRIESGLQTPTITPKFLDAYQSASLINQAYANVGDTARFSQADLDAFKNGTDPYGHPNTDWYNDIYKKFTYQLNSNLDISGGDEQLKYFISFGAFNQNGNLKSFPDPQQLVNTDYYYTRYDFRTNLDLKANKTLTLRLDVTTRFGDINAPGVVNPLNSVYNFQLENPFSAPFINPNGSWAYNYSTFTPTAAPTVNAEIANGGFSHEKRTDYNALVSAIQNLNSITDGLSLTARVAYASQEDVTRGSNILQSAQSLIKAFPSFHYDPTTGLYTKNPNAPYVYSFQDYYFLTNIYNSNLDLQVFSNYDRTFGNNHFTGLLLFNQTSSVSQSSNATNFRGLSAKVGYDYKQKILFEFNGAYNGSDAFAAGHRYGFFPAFGGGYVISKESFFHDLFPTFSLFKVRASYGVVGADLLPGGNPIYLQNYTSGGGVTFGGTSLTGLNGITEGTLANPIIEWERDKKADIGIDMNLLNDKLSATIDIFRDIRYDEFVQRQSIPALLGVAPPYENIGRVRNQGFDGQISYHNSIGGVQYNLGFVFSYAKNKILYEDEPTPAYRNLQITGTSIGQPFGYKFVRYYTAADIAQAKTYIDKWGSNAPQFDKVTGKLIASDPIGVPTYADSQTGIANLRPGDVMYQDIAGITKNPVKGTPLLMGDGVIDQFDKTAIGNPNIPNTTLGLTLGAAYKGFSVSVLFQGSFNYSYIVTGTGIEPFVSQFQPIDLKAWTPATANTAQFPLLTPDFASTVNSPTAYPSDYWYVKAYYVRLKSVDIGYQLPTKLLPFHISNARIYMSAYNLITWNNFSKYQQDPEVQTNTAGDAYINARVVNLGLQLGF